MSATPPFGTLQSSPPPRRASVVIVGGGLAGLACARLLEERRVDYLLLEASDDVGGRVRTDRVDGFLLDRGFQVLLTAYPEARRALRFDDLDLASFAPGALVRHGGRFHLVADPSRRPGSVLRSLRAPIGTLGDKARVWRLRRRALGASVGDLLHRGEDTRTLDLLRREGFSEAIIDGFFRPFFGGVFLDTDLETSSRWFLLLFRLFALGVAALPASGMQAIPRQLAEPLSGERVRLEARVRSIGGGGVELDDGTRVDAGRVVVAVDGPSRLDLGGAAAAGARRWNGVTCLYFVAPRSPLGEPYLVLGGDEGGPIDNLAVLTDVASGYSQTGEALISVTLVGSAGGDRSAAVRRQLGEWFGDAVSGWRLLREYRIPRALPFVPPGYFVPPREPGHGESRGGAATLYCGDDLETPSLQGALVAGRKAAERLLDDRA